MVQNLSPHEREWLTKFMGHLVRCTLCVRHVLHHEMLAQLFCCAAAVIIKERIPMPSRSFQQDETLSDTAVDSMPDVQSGSAQSPAAERTRALSDVLSTLSLEKQKPSRLSAALKKQQQDVREAWIVAQADLRMGERHGIQMGMTIEEFHSALLVVQGRIWANHLVLPCDREWCGRSEIEPPIGQRLNDEVDSIESLGTSLSVESLGTAPIPEKRSEPILSDSHFASTNQGPLLSSTVNGAVPDLPPRLLAQTNSKHIGRTPPLVTCYQDQMCDDAMLQRVDWQDDLWSLSEANRQDQVEDASVNAERKGDLEAAVNDVVFRRADETMPSCSSVRRDEQQQQLKQQLQQTLMMYPLPAVSNTVTTEDPISHVDEIVPSLTPRSLPTGSRWGKDPRHLFPNGMTNSDGDDEWVV